MIDNLIHSMIVCPEADREYPRLTYGKGVYLYDESGKHYIDASGGSAAVSNLGHGITGIADVLREQAALLTVLPTHAFSSPVTEAYLKKLVAFAPPGFRRAWTAMSGTEAVENALKLALQYHQLSGEPQRYKIISRWSSYHGNSIFTLDVGGMKYRRQSYTPWLHNFPHIAPAYSYRLAGGLSEAAYMQSCIAELRQCILENDPATIAAFIAEPVVGAALGAVVPPAGYFEEVRKLCDEFGILFIVDEVMTGFGRLGTNFGIDSFGVIPDIIAAGKGISGGYFPMSAIIAHEKVCRIFEEQKVPFLGGHTFACNPVGAAVGDFVISYLEREGLLQNAVSMGEILKQGLEQCRSSALVGDVRGRGLMYGVEFVQDKITKAPFPPELKLSKQIYYEGLERGVVFYPGAGSVDGVAGDHMLFCPPLCINEAEVKRSLLFLPAAWNQ